MRKYPKSLLTNWKVSNQFRQINKELKTKYISKNVLEGTFVVIVKIQINENIKNLILFS